MQLFLNEKLGELSLQLNMNEKSQAAIILAHGAGAGMNHPFMQQVATLLTQSNYTVIRFNFPYMEQGRKSPGSQANNIYALKCVYEYASKTFENQDLFIMGKSYGGRMASHLIASTPEVTTKGLIYLGFPLHAPGRDGTERASHLGQIPVPQLFMQGTKDKLANIDLMREVTQNLSLATLIEIPDADHSFHVPKRSGKTDEEVLAAMVANTSNWIREQLT